MRIVITGAAGFVGRQLVPLLADAGAELLLVGREPARLSHAFPAHATCGYADIAERAAGFDLLLHLAVVNNDAERAFQEFHAVNVELALKTAESARQAGIRRFVNVSSVHALDERSRSPYAKTKREAAERLGAMAGIDVVTVYLPAVHGDRWGGRLRFLNSLPSPVSRVLFVLSSAIRPTVRIERLKTFVLDGGHGEAAATILSDGQERNLFYHAIRRMADLTFALATAILFWWGLALIWIMIRLQSPGPGIFAQERVGRDGRVFTCYKFRTMKLGTKQAATNQVSAAAVTRLGAFLRRTKLDELPQIWNIFRNEMSLIGPRPCLPAQVELVEARRRRGVLKLIPGISGLAQAHGIDMSEPERLAGWDAKYAALQSLSMDLRIVLATAIGRGGGDRVAKDG